MRSKSDRTPGLELQGSVVNGFGVAVCLLLAAVCGFGQQTAEDPMRSTYVLGQGDQILVQGINLSTGGMGLDGVKEPLRYAGLVDVSFMLPDSEVEFQAKARLMWIGDEGRVGIRFAVIEPALFEQLQHWTNRKMKEEGWDLPS